jgi:Transcriptional regulators
VNVRKTYEIVADAIRKKIEAGEWAPGTKLPSVEKMAELFQVGRSSVREALMTLQSAGFIQVRHGGGTFVLEPKPERPPLPEVTDVERLKEWLEFRHMLETECASLAARRRKEADLVRLRAILERMRDAGNDEALEQADLQLHLCIAQASGNRWAYHALQTLFDSMGSAMKESRRLWLFAEQSESERLFEEHAAILDSIESRRAEEARRLMERHLTKVAQVLHRLF